MTDVLMITDEPALAKAAEACAQEFGARVISALTITKGMRLCLQREYDAVVLDLRMDSGLSAEILVYLRAERPEVPILVLADLRQLSVLARMDSIRSVDILCEIGSFSALRASLHNLLYRSYCMGWTTSSTIVLPPQEGRAESVH